MNNFIRFEYAILIVFLLVPLVLLHPRYTVLPFNRIEYKKIIQSSPNLVEIWKYKELFGNGFTTYNTSIIQPFSILQLIKHPEENTDITKFNSNQMTYTEKLTSKSPSNSLVCQHHQNSIVCNGIFTSDELKKSNGFYNYEESAKYIGSKNWEVTFSIRKP